jgi:hypothetical protein
MDAAQQRDPQKFVKIGAIRGYFCFGENQCFLNIKVLYFLPLRQLAFVQPVLLMHICGAFGFHLSMLVFL